MEEEIWRDVVGYEGSYIVSNTGIVKSVDRFNIKNQYIKGKELTLQTNHGGYITAAMYKNGKVKVKFVHRIVAEAFIHNPDNKPYVNHLDETRDNNNVDNLEWVTHEENINYGTRTKKAAAARSLAIIARGNGIVKKFSSTKSAAKELGISQGNLSMVLNGKRKHTHGFTFERA